MRSRSHPCGITPRERRRLLRSGLVSVLLWTRFLAICMSLLSFLPSFFCHPLTSPDFLLFRLMPLLKADADTTTQLLAAEPLTAKDCGIGEHLIHGYPYKFAQQGMFCFVLFCFVLFCFVLFCFVLFCFVLFCFVLFCFLILSNLSFFLPLLLLYRV